ncbi:MAG: hypothetical protein ACTSYR_06085 [Candidatus Odinarchaeia archaeon]
MSVNYYNYVQAINGTFTHPNVVSYNYTTIKAQNYTAKLAWEYGFLVDFIINDKDVIGELYRSNLAVEVGDIVDCNNKWREEVRNLYRGKDKAQLINFTSGPVFVQISTHKQTTYRGNLEINRTWTFYPDFWTLKTVVKLNPGDSQKIIVYSRMFHNGSKTYISSIEQDDDVIDGSTLTVKYVKSGQLLVKSDTIDGAGRHETTNDIGISQAYWCAVYKSGYDGFAYSCIPTSESLENINHFHYYDHTNDNPYHYGASGWGYYASSIDPNKLWSATLIYTPHAAQSDYSFADEDYKRIYNPVSVSIEEIQEIKTHSNFNILVLDGLSNPVYNATVTLFNASGDVKIGEILTNSQGFSSFNHILADYSYNISVSYYINGSMYSVANVTNFTFTSNYTRTVNSTIYSNLMTVKIKLIDGKTSLPLFNHTIEINSSDNNLQLYPKTDSYGWGNLTLPTYPGDLYDFNVSSPEGNRLDDNVTSPVNITQIQTIIINVTQPKFIARLLLKYLDYQIAAGSKNTGRTAIVEQHYIEIYYGDTVNITVWFYNASSTPVINITDAEIKEWRLFDGSSLITSGNLTHWNSGLYNLSLTVDDYSSNWGKTLTVKIRLVKEGGIVPPEVEVDINIKQWDTSFQYRDAYDTFLSGSTYSNYLRENITLAFEYKSLLNITDAYLDLPEINVNITSNAPSYDLTVQNIAGENGTVLIILNLTNAGVGIYTLDIDVDYNFYQPQHVTLSISVISIPTYGVLNTSSDFLLSSGIDLSIRAAINETVSIELDAVVNQTTNFDQTSLLGGSGNFIWNKGVGSINEVGGGKYSFDINLTGLVDQDTGSYTVTVILSKTNYSNIILYIDLDLLLEWPTQIDIIQRSSTIVPWGNNISILFNYYCDLAPRQGMLLNQANVEFKYDNGQPYPAQYYTIFTLSNNTYNLIFNTSANTITEDEVFLMFTTVDQTYYGERTYSLAFGVSPLEYSTNISQTYNVYIMDNFSLPLKFKISDTQSIWFNQSIPDLTINGWIYNSSSLVGNLSFVYQNGVYLTEFNSTLLVSRITSTMSYTIIINTTKQNHKTYSFTSTLNINPIPLSVDFVTLPSKTVEVKVGSDVELLITLSDQVHGRVVSNLTLNYILLNQAGQVYTSGTLTDLGNGSYYVKFSTESMDVGAYSIIFQIEGYNYELLPIEKTLIISPIQEFPLLLLIAIGASVAVAFPIGLKGYRYYKWVKLPPTVKKIILTIEGIKKEKVFELEAPVIREDVIKSNVSASLSHLKDYIPMAALTGMKFEETFKLESSKVIQELSAKLDEVLPNLSEDEKNSMIEEFINIPADEREYLIQSFKEGFIPKPIEPAMEPKVDISEIELEKSISAELEKMIDEGIISNEEKAILEVELKSLSPEEQRKFLDKIKKR